MTAPRASSAVPKTHLNVQISVPLKDRLVAYVEVTGFSQATVVSMALDEHLTRNGQAQVPR